MQTLHSQKYEATDGSLVTVIYVMEPTPVRALDETGNEIGVPLSESAKITDWLRENHQEQSKRIKK